MNRGLDFDRVLDDWLALGPDELPDPVLDRVATELDGIPQRGRAWPFGGVSASRMVIASTVAAAVVAVIIGLSVLVGPDVGEPGPSSIPGPSSLVGTEGQVLEPGSYLVEAPFPVNITFSVPPDWKTYAAVDEHLAAVCKGSECELGLAFWVIDNLPIDPCTPSLGEMDPPVGPSADDLAAALVAQDGYEATGPTRVSMSGFEGSYVELVGQGIPAGGCYERQTWTTGPHFRRSLHQEKDQIWILDIEGTRLVVNAFAIGGVPEGDRSELRAMVESVRIEAP